MESRLERHTGLVRGCVRCFPGGSNVLVVDTLRGWLAQAGVSREEIYLSALARCFPGKARGGGDKVHSRAMLTNCRSHLLREFELLAPEIAIPVGGWP